ncbi:MAG: DegT/DnrJ/EryC1/StrS family aminotransferase [Acidobacteriota bacterium]
MMTTPPSSVPPSAPLGEPRVRRHDLQPQHRRFAAEIEAACRRVLESGRYTLGDEVAAFEGAFAEATTRRHAVGVGSGTDALVLAMRVAGLEPGDEVLAPTYAPTPVAAAIVAAGGQPALVDVRRDTFLLDLERAAERVGPRTRFLLAVHLFGLPLDMAAVRQLAETHDLVVVEDGSQAHGASWRDGAHWRPAGASGDLAAFSFYPTKNLGAAGDAGIILLDDDVRAQRLRGLRNYGKRDGDPFTSYEAAAVSRLDPLQAAILGVKLQHLDRMNAERRALVESYREQLAETSIVFQAEPDGRRSAHHVLVTSAPDPTTRDALVKHLDARGIQTHVYYPTSLHEMPAWRPFVGADDRFPVAEELSRHALALPLYPELSADAVELVTDEIRAFFGCSARAKRAEVEPGAKASARPDLAAEAARDVEAADRVAAGELPIAAERHTDAEPGAHATRQSVCIIVPVYNEEENLPTTLDAALAALDTLTPDGEILIVNSGSTDRSLAVSREWAARYPRIRVLHQETREGMGSALRAAYAATSKDWICHLEADMPFDLAYLRVAARYFDDYDFVSGYRLSSETNEIMWRYASGDYLETLVRGTFHYGYKIFLNLLFNIYVNDINYSFKLARRSLLDTLDLRTDGWFIDTELVFELIKADARIKVIPVRYRERAAGESTVSFFSPIPIAWEAIKYRLRRWRRP